MAGYFLIGNNGNIFFFYGYEEPDCRAFSKDKTATPQVRSMRLVLWWNLHDLKSVSSRGCTRGGGDICEPLNGEIWWLLKEPANRSRVKT